MDLCTNQASNNIASSQQFSSSLKQSSPPVNSIQPLGNKKFSSSLNNPVNNSSPDNSVPVSSKYLQSLQSSLQSLRQSSQQSSLRSTIQPLATNPGSQFFLYLSNPPAICLPTYPSLYRTYSYTNWHVHLA